MTPCGQCGFWGPGRGWRHALRGFAAASTCNWGRCMENYINVEWCWYFLRIWMLLLLLRSCGKTSQADSWNPAGFGTTLNRSVGVSGKQQSVLSPVAKAWHCNHCNCCGTKTLVCWTGGATPEINDVSFSFCYVTMSIQNSIFFLARSSYSKNSERSLEGRWEKNWTSMDLWDKLKLTFFSCGILPWDFHEAYETFPFGYTDLGMTEKDMLRKEVGPRWQWRVENLWGVSWPPNSCYVVSLQLESLMVTSETFKNCGERGSDIWPILSVHQSSWGCYDAVDAGNGKAKTREERLETQEISRIPT